MNAYAPQQHTTPQQQMFMTPNQQQVFQQQQIPQQFVPQQGGAPLGIPGSSFVPQQTMVPQQTPQMGQQSFMTSMPQHQQPQQPMMSTMQQQSGSVGGTSFNTPSPANWQQTQSQTQSIPADILGLADKAASAVQALQASRSSGPIVNMSTPAQMVPMMQMQGQQPMQPNTFSSYSNSVPSSQPPPYRRPRTTASMSELPIMVQYAVQVSNDCQKCM